MFTLVINLQTVWYLTNERQFNIEAIFSNCESLWCSSAMSNNTGNTRNSSTGFGGTYLALLQNFLIVASVLLIPCIVFAAPCSFETLSFNAVMQVSLSPSPSVHFEQCDPLLSVRLSFLCFSMGDLHKNVKKTVEREILIVWVYELEEIISIVIYMNQHAWLNELGLEEEKRKTFGRGIIVKLLMYSLFRITNTHESYILIKRVHLLLL